jgi:hypothetical protein
MRFWAEFDPDDAARSLDFASEMGSSIAAAAGGVEWGMAKEELYIFKGLAMPGMIIEFSEAAAFYGDVPVHQDPGVDRAVEALFDGIKAVLKHAGKSRQHE